MLSKKTDSNRCMAILKNPSTSKCPNLVAVKQGCKYLCKEHADEFMILGWPGALYIPEIKTKTSESKEMCRDPFALFVDHNKWSVSGDKGIKVAEYSDAVNVSNLSGKPQEWVKLDKTPVYHNFCNQQDCILMLVTTNIYDYSLLNETEKKTAHKPHIFRLNNTMWDRILKDFPEIGTYKNNGKSDSKYKVFPPVFSVKNVTNLLNHFTSNPETHYPFWTTTLRLKDWEKFYHGLNLLKCQDLGLIQLSMMFVDKFKSGFETIITTNENGLNRHYFSAHDPIIKNSRWIQRFIGRSQKSNKEPIQPTQSIQPNQPINVIFDSMNLSIILNKLNGLFKTNDACSVSNVINDIIYAGFEFDTSTEQLQEYVFNNLFNYIGSRCHFKSHLSQMWVNTSDKKYDIFMNGVELLRDRIGFGDERLKIFEHYFPKFIRSIDDIPDFDNYTRRYAKCRDVSKGSFGAVLSCFDNDSRDSKVVALKKQKIDKSHIQHTVNEINLLLHICPHTNILNIENFFKDKDNVYIVTPYHKFGTLKKKINDAIHPPEKKPWIRPTALSSKDIKSIMQQILHGLNWIHQRGVIHADLKPDNIMVNNKGNLEIIDFGSAKTFYNKRGHHFKYGTEIVTMLYRAPELFPDMPYYSLVLTPAIDTWAAGVILLQLLTPDNPNDTPFSITRDQFMKYFVDTKTKEPEKDALDEWNKIYNILVRNALRDFMDLDKNEISSSKLINFVYRFGNRDVIGGDFTKNPLCDLLLRLLILNPQKRIDAANALTHPSFNGITHIADIKTCSVSVSQIEREKRKRDEIERKRDDKDKRNDRKLEYSRERDDRKGDDRKRDDRKRDDRKRDDSDRKRDDSDRKRDDSDRKRDDRKRDNSRERRKSSERSGKRGREDMEGEVVELSVNQLPQIQPIQPTQIQPTQIQETKVVQKREKRDESEKGIVEQFKAIKDNDIEFEIRFDERPSFEKFKSTLDNFIDDSICSENDICKCEQSISRISKNGIRQETYFDKGKQTKEVTMTKQRIGVENRNNYKISLSRETISRDNVTEKNELSHIRIKLRTSIKKGMWRYDFTAAIELKNEVDVQQFASQLLTKDNLNYGNIVQYLEKVYTMNFKDKNVLTFEYEIEFIGDKSDLSREDIEKAVDTLNSYKNYQSILYQIAKITHANRPENYLDRYGLKQLCNQPKNLTRNVFDSHVKNNVANFYVSDKADGERCLVVFMQKKVQIILSNKVVNMTNVFGEAPTKEMTVLDAEIANMKRLYIFDVLVDNGNSVTDQSFKVRQGMIDKYVSLNVGGHGGSFIKKKLIRLDTMNWKTQIYEMYKRNRDYKIDGLIFTPIDGSYFSMTVYKWKDPSELTIDFMIVKPPSDISMKYPQKVGHTLYMLFSGISEKDNKIALIDNYSQIMSGIRYSKNYFPIQFQPQFLFYSQDNALHHKVGEFIWKKDVPSSDKGEWILYRVRPDKSILVKKGLAYGNNYRIAKEIFDMYYNPLTIEMLTK